MFKFKNFFIALSVITMITSNGMHVSQVLESAAKQSSALSFDWKQHAKKTGVSVLLTAALAGCSFVQLGERLHNADNAFYQLKIFGGLCVGTGFWALNTAQCLYDAIQDYREFHKNLQLSDIHENSIAK
jgi:hypothetical protein